MTKIAATLTKNLVFENIKKLITTIAKKIKDLYGDLNLLVLENLLEIWFSSDIKNIVFEEEIILEFAADKVDIKADIGKRIKIGPIVFSATNITEDILKFTFKTDRTTMSINIYKKSTNRSDSIMALGIVFLGSLTSSDIFVIAWNPIKEIKIIPIVEKIEEIFPPL